MDPLLGMFLGSLAFGGLTSGGGFLMSAKEAKRQRQFQAAEAQKQRDWMTDMSNTAHQREVDDLYAAGLNPILSANGGSGASTPAAGGLPSGAMPTISDPSHSAVAMLGALSKAMKEQSLLDGELEKLEAETKFIHSQNWATADNVRLARDRLNFDQDRFKTEHGWNKEKFYDDWDFRAQIHNNEWKNKEILHNNEWANKIKIEQMRIDSAKDLQSARLNQEHDLMLKRFRNELDKAWIQAGSRLVGDGVKLIKK